MVPNKKEGGEGSGEERTARPLGVAKSILGWGGVNDTDIHEEMLLKLS